MFSFFRSMKIELENKIVNNEYTQYIYDNYDIQNQEKTNVLIETDVEDYIDTEFNLGVIFGNSGSGKSTILNKLGTSVEPKFNNESLISNFDWMTPKEATFLLSSMGLSSVPTWLRPYHTLSNGEQYRAKLAYIVGKAKENELVLIDEFTSVVDRNVAKAMSNSLQKYVRRANKKVVLATCHTDVLDWLNPDWICSPQKNNGKVEITKGRLKPTITLQVSRVKHEVWNLFKKHHYLTEDSNKSGKYFLFEWDGKPVCMVVLLNFPSGTAKNGVRLSRTVVLPDFQGMGIGSKASEFVASLAIANGKRCFSKTVNPALGEYRNKSDNWKPTSKHMKTLRGQKKGVGVGEHAWATKKRPSYCHEYIGDGVSDDFLFLSPDELRNKQQLDMFGTIIDK